MVVTMALEEVGADCVHGGVVEDEGEDGESEEAGLGITGDEDP